MKPLSLEQQLAASIDYVREARRQRDDLDEWLDAAPVPPKKLPRKKMEPQSIVVHRDVTPVLEFTQEQRAMIRDTFAGGANESEFQVLMEVAKLRRLNPLLKQIHFVKRYSKDANGGRGGFLWAAQVSVDGLRAIAERTGKYDGQDEAEFGPMVHGFPEFARVRVYRKDWTRPAIGTAYWSEYVQKTKDGAPTRFWREMPRVMLAKCAEAIAMRKAFPEDMGGLYTDEEMQQADNAQFSANGSHGALSPHVGPGDDPAAPGDVDLFRHLCGRFSTIESDLERCDSWDKVCALRSLLGTRAAQSELTRTMQQRAEAGDISPSQRQELGKSWMRCNRKLEKLEEKYKPVLESSFVVDPEDGAEDRESTELDAFSPRAETEES